MNHLLRNPLTCLFLATALLAACLDVQDDDPALGAVESAATGTMSARRFYAIGDALTPSQNAFTGNLTLASAGCVTLRVDGAATPGSPTCGAVGATLALTTDISGLTPGQHQVEVVDASGGAVVASVAIQRTRPYYVFVSNDWDKSDNTGASYTQQEALHTKHPALVVTHFVGPYTFTDPALTDARRQWIASWLLRMSSQYGDELGLHIHPYCNFVTTTGTACRHTDTYYASEAASGYSVMLASYTEPETLTLLKGADALFQTWGLGKPRTFRAGGWIAETHTLRALAADGFVVDASAANWRRLSSWQGVPGASLYEWNRDHWGPINDLSQPYFPSVNDKLTSTPPVMSILEVPDNGLLADYMTTQAMIDVFTANWNAYLPNRSPVLSIGYHATSIDRNGGAYGQQLDGALTYIDNHLLANGTGPVVYVRAKDIPLVMGSVPPPIPPSNPWPMNNSATVTKGQWKNYVTPTLQPGTYNFTMTGTGDADLYVRVGNAPTATLYDCRPYANGSSEQCPVTLTQAGVIHVGVQGYATTSTVTIKGDVVATPPPPPNPWSLSDTATVAKDQWKSYASPSLPAGRYNVTMTGTGDADLYVRAGSAPTATLYDCRPYANGSSEQCPVTLTQPGVIYIGVKGYATSSTYTLTGRAQ